MALFATSGELFPGLREDDGTVGGAGDPAFALESLESFAGGDVGDAQAVGNFGEARFAQLVNEVPDEFHVVFGPLTTVMFAGGLVADGFAHGFSMGDGKCRVA